MPPTCRRRVGPATGSWPAEEEGGSVAWYEGCHAQGCFPSEPVLQVQHHSLDRLSPRSRQVVLRRGAGPETEGYMKRSWNLKGRLAVLAFVLVSGAGPALAQPPALAPAQELAAQELAAQCRRTVTAHVVALNQPLYMNRLGANMPGGMIFALAGDVFPQGTEPDGQTIKNSCRFQTCTHGQVQLRDGKRPRPIVLRANE